MSFDKPTFFAASLVLFWALAIGTGVLTPYGWIVDSAGRPVDADYIGFYAAGSLALQGQASAAYDWARDFAVQHALLKTSAASFYPWPYPPTFLLVAAPFATLPYAASMRLWTLVMLTAYAGAIAKITTTRRDMWLMLATPAAWFSIYVGQNGMFSAALVGFGLVLLRTRPLVAGLCFGALSYKPHLGLLIPIALLAGGHVRTFASATATVIALAAIATALFGVEAWLAFTGQLSRVADSATSETSTLALQSVFEMGRQFGLTNNQALYLHGATLVVVAASIAYLWRRRDVPFDLKAAALATAMTLASPYQFVYDLTILTVAQAFLLRYLGTTGARRADYYMLLLANALVFHACSTSFPFGIVASLVIGSMIANKIFAATPAKDRLVGISPAAA